MRIDLPGGADPVARIRAESAESVVIVFAPGGDPVARAQAEAAIGALAMERAPAGRLSAIVAGDDTAAVDAAAAFLDGATSTTGQVLRVG